MTCRHSRRSAEPRIRIGDLAKPIKLADGSDVVLVFEHLASGDEIPVTYEMLADDVHVGDRIMISDGLLELVVLDVTKPRA